MMKSIMRSTMLSLCHKDTTFNHLKQIHSLLIKLNPSQNHYLLSKLLTCITPNSNPSHLSYASFLINHAQQAPTKLWNSIIIAFSKTSEPRRSLVSYATMCRNGVAPDPHTFPSLLKVFFKVESIDPFQFYAQTFKFGLNLDQFVSNSFVSVLCGFGYLRDAYQVFVESSEKDVVGFTALVDGCVRNGNGLEAMRFFAEMRLVAGIRVDEMSVVSALRGAGMTREVWFGKWVHGFYVEAGRVKWDVYVGSALVDMYMKCGCHEDARRVFDGMASRNVVSWSALIGGYVQCERFKDALVVLRCIVADDVKPNQSTLSSALTSCAHIGALHQGKLIHGYIYRHNIEVNLLLGTGLVDTYAKCGCIDKALLVFRRLPTKGVFTWTAMINGLAAHGEALGALNLFSQILQNGILPNKVTFMGVLSACAHRGLVDEGRKVFRSMKHVFHLEPHVDHYGCMIDLLGRAGHLEEARRMIEDMPMVPTAGIWGTFLSSCVVHKNFELGELAGSHLIKLDSNHSGRYVLLANLYSTWKKWKVAAGIRKLMKGKGVEKLTGYSWIEINGEMFEFEAFDKSHCESDRICLMLDSMLVQMRLSGYVVDINLLAF